MLKWLFVKILTQSVIKIGKGLEIGLLSATALVFISLLQLFLVGLVLSKNKFYVVIISRKILCMYFVKILNKRSMLFILDFTGQ